MARLAGMDDLESARTELSELGSSWRSSSRYHGSSFGSDSASTLAENVDVDDETALKWAEIEKLPVFEQLRLSVFDEKDEANSKGKRVVDVTKLGPLERQMFIQKIIKHVEHDNLRLLHKIRKRIDK